MARKKFKELDLKNAFLFAAALEDPETCELVLEIILDREVGPVQVQVESSLLFSSDYRYVRFDVFAKDTTDVSYDVEMQNGHKSELPKRSRYHQAEMDAMCLTSGQRFTDLPDSFVVFICTFDPFDSGLYRYTYEEICRETGEALEDGACRIFFNTQGTNDAEVSKTLVDFLHYVENSTQECAEQSDNEQIRKLDRKLMALKQSRRLEEKYMTMQELMDDQRTEGMAEGRAEGEKRSLTLISLMLQDGMSEEIQRLSSDSEFYHSMLEKYHII